MELSITHLTKRFGAVTAVDNVNLQMAHGVIGLLGVNGSGKTTLMRMLCTLLTPTSGQITLDGRDIFTMDAQYRALLGYLPQEFGFYPEFSVRDYLRYIAAIKGLRPAVAKARVEAAIAQVGLEKNARQKMKRLSGGMKRRVGIAQAILNDPAILILDEPTAGLDPNERVRFRNLISELADDRLVLLSTHIVSDVEYIAEHILLMKDGRFIHRGSADHLIDTLPASVWQCHVDKSAVPAFTKKYKVANLKNDATGVNLRIIADTPPVGNATPLSATLEDVFLYYFGETGAHPDDPQ